MPENDECPFEAIVGDVGLVLDLAKRDVDLKRIEGNPYYTAPECLTGQAPYSTAADVFSFGLLICEIISGHINDGYKIPRLHVSPFVYYSVLLQSFALDAESLPLLPECPSWLFELAKNCCQMDYLQRPHTEQILQLLEHNLHGEVNTCNANKKPVPLRRFSMLTDRRENKISPISTESVDDLVTIKCDDSLKSQETSSSSAKVSLLFLRSIEFIHSSTC
ncbi:Dual specificity testis-specific protein kinase 2 [Cichlidogyrus casuarinus]|uniref:Dual specificity testis-specific protein kinase 2 n=1 Tax=Cichlidogyrus casuarinus TaxID=1844966 RepID=A0ABD2QJ98_9PLAT